MTLLLVFQELMRHRKLTVVAQRLGAGRGPLRDEVLAACKPELSGPTGGDGD
jgi:hypothetical protein